jgi:hypothetical protein
MQAKMHVFLLPLLTLAVACGGERARAQNESAGTRVQLETQPWASDPCGWVTAAEVGRLIGPLEGAPRRGKSAENPSAQEGGSACVYILAGTGSNEGVAIQVDHEDPMRYETGVAMALGSLGIDTAQPDGPQPPEGWDYMAQITPREIVGRVGHLAVVLGLFTGRVPEDRVIELATLVRDRVPDLPVAAEYGDPNAEAWGPDPCSLVSREEAEAVLGKLMIPPYRSKESTPFADGHGQGCSYYRGNHRVLVLSAEWSDGRETFGLGAGLTDQITSTTGVGEQSADTLDGPWDQAKGDIGGGLSFLVGDRMLEMQYHTSGVDTKGALRLATLAVERLKTAE